MNPRVTRGKQLDIQGLRALAVVLVVVNHLTGRPVGGFVGVDVFFVISGFLITGHLVRDAERGPRNLRGYLVDFYARRIRRLLPAATVTTIAIWATSHFLFLGARAHSTVTDGIWSTFFVANWRFIETGTDYFAAGDGESPFQHYWSLSVEEQFYVVWPLLTFGALVVAGSRRSLRSRRITMLAVATTVGVASFVWAWASSDAHPVVAYFSTWTRAWELAAGAALALLVQRRRLARPWAMLLSWAGLAAIAVSVFTVHSGPGFPAPGAVLPCVGALAVLASTATAGTRVNGILAVRPAVAIGDMSYAIYLVHFPVIVFMPSFVSADSPFFDVAAILLIVGASFVLHYGIEKPVLASRWLQRPRPLRKRDTGVKIFEIDRLAIGIGIALVALTLPTLWSGDTDAIDSKYDAINDALIRDSVAGGTAAGATTALGPTETVWQRSIRDALVSTSWPTLDPGVAAESERDPVPRGLLACGDIVLRSAGECTFGPRSAPRTVYVVGDSTSMAYVAAYRQIVEEPGSTWKMRVAGAYGCATSTIPIANPDADDVAQCAAHNDAVVAEINSTHPDLVLATNTYAARQDARTGATLSDAEWTASLAGVLDRITAPTQVALVEPAPTGTAAINCYDADSSPTACVYQIPAAHRSRAAAETALAKSHRWAFVRTDTWFCDLGTGYCPAFVGTTLVKHDTVHISYAYDEKVADVMRETFTRNKLLAS